MPNRVAEDNRVAQTDTAVTAGDNVTIGAASAALVAANPGRVAVWLTNTHATQTVYISLGGTAVAAKGIFLAAAGGTVKITEYTGAINGIASGATTPVAVTEV